MAWQRRAGTVAAFLIGLAAHGSLATVGAQQTIAKGQTAGPRFMVPVLKSHERSLGSQVAEAIRDRMSGDFMGRTLWIIPRTDIENALEQSGYSKTDPLNSNDAKQLANLIHAEEYIEGSVDKTDAGYDFDGVMMLVRGEGMVQPLPHITGAKIGDIAKGVSGAIEQARKPVDDVNKCTLSARQSKYAEALLEAQKGLKDYPNSVMARVCMLEVYNSKKLGPDSIIRVAEEILAIHKANRRALSLVADAYAAKKMDDKYIDALTKLLSADPTNARLTETVVNEIARIGKPEVARPIIDEAVKQNPGDPALIRLQWRIYLALKEYKQATAIGEEMVKTDSAAADTTFFTRIIAAFSTDSNYQKAAEWAARGTAKFPQNVGLLQLMSQVERQAGQLPLALDAINKVLAINPKQPGAHLAKARIFLEMNQPDSVIATLDAAVAAGDDKAAVAGMANTMANRIRTAYQTSKDTADLSKGLRVLAAAEKAGPTEQTFLLKGMFSLLLGQSILQDAAKEKSCEKSKTAGDLFADASINLPKAGRAFPKEVGQLLQAVTDMGNYVDQVKKAYCK